MAFQDKKPAKNEVSLNLSFTPDPGDNPIQTASKGNRSAGQKSKIFSPRGAVPVSPAAAFTSLGLVRTRETSAAIGGFVYNREGRLRLARDPSSRMQSPSRQR